MPNCLTKALRQETVGWLVGWLVFTASQHLGYFMYKKQIYIFPNSSNTKMKRKQSLPLSEYKPQRSFATMTDVMPNGMGRKEIYVSDDHWFLKILF